MKKVNNFQDEFSIQDIEIARDVRATYDCGMSRIALKAPDQIYRNSRELMKNHDVSASIKATTLKLHYAIKVWDKAAHISLNNPNYLLNYWWINWVSDGSPFNKLEYSNNYRDIAEEQMMQRFWKLLEEIADSGVIMVSEGYQFYSKVNKQIGPKLVCVIVLDENTGDDIYKKVDDVYTYPYDRTLRTFKWDEIKDFFCEMSLNQLRLTMPEQLHYHTFLNDGFLKACKDWDEEQIKYYLENGANVNCLDQYGESSIQQVINDYKEHGLLKGKEYSEEELNVIEKDNERKCKEIIDLLLSYGADINLFGYEGNSPLMCAYEMKSPELVKFLLERGANPNSNCSLVDDDYWPTIKNIRSSILYKIDDLIYEDHDDIVDEIERIIHDAGGRQYVWDYNPWVIGNEGKYVVHLTPSKKGDKIFTDNARWLIGTAEELVIEDKDGYQTNIALNSIEGLRQWNADFQANITNPGYDWQSWKKRGFELACQVAKLLSDKVAMFYLYDNETVVQKAYWHPDHTPSPNELTLCCYGEPIRIG